MVSAKCLVDIDAFGIVREVTSEISHYCPVAFTGVADYGDPGVGAFPIFHTNSPCAFCVTTHGAKEWSLGQGCVTLSLLHGEINKQEETNNLRTAF